MRVCKETDDVRRCLIQAGNGVDPRGVGHQRRPQIRPEDVVLARPAVPGLALLLRVEDGVVDGDRPSLLGDLVAELHHLVDEFLLANQQHFQRLSCLSLGLPLPDQHLDLTERGLLPSRQIHAASFPWLQHPQGIGEE